MWKRKESEAIEILVKQLQYRRTVLQQKFPNKKLLQKDEKGEDGKYKKYSLDVLKEHLCQIFIFLKKTPEKRAT